jgi:hypothetical protein
MYTGFAEVTDEDTDDGAVALDDADVEVDRIVCDQ